MHGLLVACLSLLPEIHSCAPSRISDECKRDTICADEDLDSRFWRPMSSSVRCPWQWQIGVNVALTSPTSHVDGLSPMRAVATVHKSHIPGHRKAKQTNT